MKCLKKYIAIWKQHKVLFGLELVIIGLALFSTAKLFFLGMSVDEEYAVAMSYRMISGDQMFVNMWEPHQTSGFVCAFFIRLFLLFARTPDYLVLYLRFVGFLMQSAISCFVYSVFRKRFEQPVSFICAMLCYTLLPKWILTPEFSNLLLWSSLGVCMCFLRIAWDEAGAFRYLIAAGIFTCIAILAYPTCLLVVPCYLYGLHLQFGSKGRRYMGCYIASCAVIGLGYLTYFLSHLSVSELLFGLRQMLSDGAHSVSLLQKLSFWGWEMQSWGWLLLGLLVLSGLLCLCFRIRSLRVFLQLMLLFSLIHQFFYWHLGKSLFLNEPLLFFYLAYIMGFFVHSHKSPLFRMVFLPSGIMWFSAILLTNTGIRVTGAFLLPGILTVFPVLFEPDRTKAHPFLQRFLPRITACALLLLLLFERGYMVYENGGYRADIHFVKQKALSGPAKNIYCRYLDGYDYNIVADLLAQYAGEEDVLLCASGHSLWYMLSSARIGNYSTISTPTFDERLTEYWQYHPDHYPTLVIGYEDSEELKQLEQFLHLEEPLAQEKWMVLYRVNPSRAESSPQEISR